MRLSMLRTLGLALLASSFAPSAGFAQWLPHGLSEFGGGSVVPDPLGGVIRLGGQAVRYSHDGYLVAGPVNDGIGALSVNSDGAGGALATINVYGVLAAVHIDANLARVWPGANGVQLTTHTATALQSPFGALDGAGNGLFAWSDRTASNYDIYAQKVSSAGVAQWAPQGVAVCTLPSNQGPESLVPDEAGGLIIVWQDQRRGLTACDVYAQHLDVNGSLLWQTNGVRVNTHIGDDVEIVTLPDGAGGVIVAWEDSVAGLRDIRAQRLDATGALQWGSAGTLVCGATGDQDLPVIVSDGAGGAIIAWEDHRAGGNNLDIYAQRVSAAGVTQWATDGVPVCTAAGKQERPSIVTDGSGGAVLAWPDARAGQAEGAPRDLFVQRLSGVGLPQWTADGVRVTHNTAAQTRPPLATDGAGGAFVLASGLLFAIRGTGEAGWIPNFRCTIASVLDEPSDQGGVVRLELLAPLADTGPLSPTVSGYTIWRRIPGTALDAHPGPALSAADAIGEARRGRAWLGPAQALAAGFPPGTWESIGYTPATQSADYLLAAVTHDDSTSAGTPYDTYVVTTNTTDPPIYTVSAADSGYSVDNLPPAPPQNVLGNYGSGTTNLDWTQNRERDLAGYDVYRGPDSTFVASPATRIGTTAAPQFTDPGASATSWYRITALDAHGNESGSARVGPAQALAVGNAEPPRASFARATTPNPFAARATIEYGLARSGPVALAVFDAQGRRVATLASGDRVAGTYHVTWNAAVAGPGVYLMRFEAPGVSCTLRLVRVR